jgi:20S proteasome alpha/beta subunit
VYSSVQIKYKSRLKKHPQLTCIIGGKCVDGVVLVSDSKVTYDDHPPSYEAKLHSEFYHIVTGGAGSMDLYNEYRTRALFATQPGVIISDTRLEQPRHDSRQRVQTSGIVHMYNGEYNFTSLQNNFGNLVKAINNSKVARDLNGSLEILVATQIGDKGTAELTHFTDKTQSDVYDYRGIGSSGIYANVFLKPFFDKEKNITMNKFAKIGYFMIKLLTEYEIDQTVGGEPQIWFIPNTGPLYRDKDRPELISQFEKDSQNMLAQFQKLLAFAYQ